MKTALEFLKSDDTIDTTNLPSYFWYLAEDIADIMDDYVYYKFPFSDREILFIMQALNRDWNQSHTTLTEVKPLGDIEVEHLNYQKDMAKQLLTKLETKFPHL